MDAAPLPEPAMPRVGVLPPAPPPGMAEEAHHRVANSLQMLGALLAIEGRSVRDVAALAALDRTQQRIAAVASVHRQLYQSPGSGTVDLGAYLQTLGPDLQRSAAAGRRVRVEPARLIVTAGEATSVGMIVCEAVCNALKYAYAPGAPGDVHIRLRHLSHGGYLVEVADGGAGRSPGDVQGSGFGSRLIALLAARIGGQVSYDDAAPGTRFLLAVTPPSATARP